MTNSVLIAKRRVAVWFFCPEFLHGILLGSFLLLFGLPARALPPTLTPPPSQPLCLVQGQAMNPWSASLASGSATAFWVSGLPSGLTMNPANGTISGTPLASGTYNVLVGARDGKEDSSPEVLRINVYPPGGNAPQSPYLASYNFSTNSRDVTATGLDPSSRLLALAALPGGLSLATNNARLVGNPTVPGHYTLALAATNVYGQTRIVPDPLISHAPQPWSSQTASASASLSDVAYNGSRYVAVGAGGTIRTSNNFTSWTTRSSGTTDGFVSVAHTGTMFLAGTSTGSIYSSPDGATWTSRVTNTTASIQGFAAGNGILAAVGASNTLLTSPDGITWTSRLPMGTTVLSDVVFGNGLFVAVGSAGKILTSSDGITWTDRSVNTSQSLRAVQYGNGRFVVIGSTAVFISTDGVAWRPATGSVSTSLSSLVFGGGVFLATTGSSTLFSSVDGDVWQSEAYGTGGAQGIYAQNRFVLVSGTALLTSASSSWVPVPSAITNLTIQLGQPLTGQIFATNSPSSYSALYLPDGFTLNATTGVISGTPTQSGQFGIRCFASNAGGPGPYTTWIVNVLAPPSAAPAVSYASWSLGGNCFVTRLGSGAASEFTLSNADTSTTVEALSMVPGLTLTRNSASTFTVSGTPTVRGIHPLILKLTNAAGSNTVQYDWIVWDTGWVRETGGPTLRDVEFGNGTFVAIDSNNRIRTSADALTWTDRGPAATTTTRFLNGLFLQIGSGGNLQTSEDGISWTPRATGTTSDFADASYGSGNYVVVGSGGVILRSPDAVNWTVVASGVTSPLGQVEYFGGQFLATTSGSSPVGLVSTDGATWTQRALPNTSFAVFDLFASDLGWILRQDKRRTSLDAINWVVEPAVTLRGNSYPNGVPGPYRQMGERILSLAGSNTFPSRAPGGEWEPNRTPLNTTYRDVAFGNGYSVLAAATASGYWRQAELWPPVLMGPTLFSLRSGTPFSLQLTATNSPTTFHVWNLPPWLTLDPLSGLLSGTPTGGEAAYGIQVVAENASGLSEPLSISFAVRRAEGTSPALTSPQTASGFTGRAFSYSITADNTDYSTLYSAQNLPPGITCDPATGLLSGTPTAPGDFAVTIGATNVYGSTTEAIILSISAPPWTDPGLTFTPGFAATTYANGTFVVAGKGMHYSPDGVTWIPAALSGLPNGADVPRFTASAYGNGIWVAVGVSGALATASDPAAWQMRVQPAYGLPGYADVTFGDGLFVAVSDQGIHTSPDGITWTPSTGTPDYVGLTAVAYHSGAFVAVGSRQTILRSTDGINWTTIATEWLGNSFTEVNWLNDRFFAFAYGALWTSPDGIAWQTSTFLPQTYVSAATYGDGVYVVAVGVNSIYMSYDGTDWFVTESGLSGSLGALYGAAFGDGTFVLSGPILLLAQGAVPRLHNPGSLEARAGQVFQVDPTCSGDVVSFGSAGLPSGLQLDEVTGRISGIPDAPGDYRITLSARNAVGPAVPVTFRLRILPAQGPLPELLSPSVFYVGTTGPARTYALEASHLTAASTVSVSGLPDGVTFDPVSRQISGSASLAGNTNATITLTNAYGQTVAALRVEAGNRMWNPEGPLLQSPTLIGVATGNGITVAASSSLYVYYSTGSGSWTRRSTASSGGALDLAFGNGVFVIVTSAGEIITSSDGQVWTKRVSGVSVSIRSVTFANGLFLCTTADGRVLSSPDAITWTSRASGVTTSLEGIAYGNGLYAVVGANNVLRTSPDLVTWSPQSPGLSGVSFQGIAWGNGRFVACGSNRSIITSPDGVTWSVSAQSWTASATFAGIAFGNGRFVVQTDRNVIHSADGVDWRSSHEAPDLSLRAIHFDGSRFLLSSNAGYFFSCIEPRSPSIFSRDKIQGFVGQPVSYEVRATNLPTGYSANGLPPGLVLDSLTGSVSGTPTRAGRYAVTVRSSNSWGTDIQEVEMEILSNPGLLPLPAAASGAVGRWFEWDPSLPENGGFYASSSLPVGLAINAVTGVISGTPEETGLFAVTITSSHPSGNRTGELLLTVHYPPPMILRQPGDQSVLEGEPILLQATASGGGDLSYRWEKNGVALANSSNVSGANQPTLLITAAQATDTGDYQLVVANPAGESVTRSARVLARRTFANWLATRGLAPGGSGLLDTPEFPGISNIVSYALGIPPGTNPSDHLPTIEIGGEGPLYRFRTADLLGDVGFTVETSTNLSNWSSNGVELFHLGSSEGYDHWEARVDEATFRRFFRLRVYPVP